jgi:hypothetical protein
MLCAVKAPTVRIGAAYSAFASACGAASLNCALLNTSLALFPLVGTTFLFESGTHAIGAGVVSAVADLRLTSATGNAALTTLDCGGATCLQLSGNGLIIDGVTLANGYASDLGGAFTVARWQQVTMRNAVVAGCSAQNGGGGVYVEGELLVSGSTFSACTALAAATGAGGAILARMSTAPLGPGASKHRAARVWLNATTFVNCAAANGGALSAVSATLTTTATAFRGNTASVRGGAVDAQLLTWTGADTRLAGNAAVIGGGVYASDSIMTLGGGCEFTANVANSSGGAFYLSFADLRLSNALVADNSVPDAVSGEGGAVYVMGNRAFEWTNVVVRANVCANIGGAVRALFSAPVFAACTFERNRARQGGAVYLGLQAGISVTATRFASNWADDAGGAFSAQECAPVTIGGGSVFWNNSAAVAGGAYHVLGKVTTNLNACAFELNAAPAGGAIYWNRQAPVLTACTFAGNTAQQGPNWASEPKSIAWTNALVPPAYEFNSAYVVQYPLQAALLDFYQQVVAVDNTTFLQAGSSQTNVSVAGITSARLDRGTLTLPTIVVVLRPNTVANIFLTGFFQGIGTYMSPQLAVPLRQCTPGEYYNGVDRCLLCPKGQYSPIAGATTCTVCAAGSFANVSGLSVCPLCALGYAAAAVGSISCSPCTLGRYANVPGLRDCPSCPPGTASIAPGSPVCAICQPGQEAASRGQVLSTAFEFRMCCDAFGLFFSVL